MNLINIITNHGIFQSYKNKDVIAIRMDGHWLLYNTPY